MRYFIDLVQVLAWPGAVVLLGYIFRRELNDTVLIHLRPKPQRIAYRLASTMKEAKELAAKVIAASGGKPDTKSSEFYKQSHDQIQRLARTSPRAAIIETWVEFEANLLEVAEKVEIYSRGPLASRRIVEKLVAQKKIPEEMLRLFQILREVRNKATYVPDYTFDNEDAESYFDLYFLMVHVINKSVGAASPTVANIGFTFSDE